MSRTIHSFTDMLALLSRGKFVEKCDEHLQNAISTLEALPDESGKVTITMTVDVIYLSGRVDIRPAIKSKLPEEKGFNGTPFWSLEGGLSVQHPSQADMFAGPRDAAERRNQESA